MKNHTKIFQFKTLNTKLWLGKSYCVLGSTRQMDLLKFMMEIEVQYYLVPRNMVQFTIGLDKSKRWYYIFFSHNYARIKLFYMILCFQKKKLTLHNVIIIIQSVFNKNQNHYYCNVFLEKCSYTLRKMFVYSQKNVRINQLKNNGNKYYTQVF